MSDTIDRAVVLRLARHGRDLAAALRQEFGALMAARPKDNGLGARLVAKVDELDRVARVVLARTEAGTPCPRDAFQGLQAVIKGALELADFARHSGAAGGARAASTMALPGPRPTPKAAAPAGTSPVDTRPVSATERLKAWITPPSKTRVQTAPVDAQTVYVHAFLRFADEVLGELSPRLAAVEGALVVPALPPTAREQHAVFEQALIVARRAGMAPGLACWVPSLVRLFGTHPTAGRVGRSAVDDRTTAQACQTETRAWKQGVPFDPHAYRTALLPLVRLPATVQHVPTLSVLFPLPLPGKPPAWAASERTFQALPVSEAPAAPVPRATPRQVDPEAERSSRRLALAAMYLQDPANPAIADRVVLFRLMSEERTYQEARAKDLAERRRHAQPGALPGWEEQLAEATDLAATLTSLLQALGHEARARL